MTNIIETNVGIRCQMCGVVNWPTAMACMNCNERLDKRPAREMFSYTTSGAMSFSQKVARFFEIMDYLVLAPAIMGLMLSLTVIGNAPLFTLAIAAAFTAGCLLLCGFFMHSRGKLNESKIYALWCATIIYNVIDLIVTMLVVNSSRDGVSFIFALWPLLVIILSAMALVSEAQKTKAYASV